MKYLKYYENNDIDPFSEEEWEEKDLYDVSDEDQAWAKTQSDKWFYFLSSLGPVDFKVELDGMKIKLIYDEELKAFKNSFDNDIVSVEELKNKKLNRDEYEETIIIENDWQEFGKLFVQKMRDCTEGLNKLIRHVKENNIENEDVLNTIRALKLIYESFLIKPDENKEELKNILTEFKKGNVYLRDLFEKYITNK